MGHSWATLSFETVESSFYPQSPIKVSYETSLVPSEPLRSFGPQYLVLIVGTISNFKFDPIN